MRETAGSNAPVQDPCPTFPLGRVLEAGIAGHEVAHVRMQLVFRPEIQLQCVQQRDERLLPVRLSSARRSKGSGRMKEAKDRPE